MRRPLVRVVLALGFAALAAIQSIPIRAQTAGPTLLAPGLQVRAVVEGLVTPISAAFIGPNDLLVLEKNTGRVVRVTGGAVQGTVLDLSVNFASERGLLGIALDPDFPADPGVYLFWSCRSTAPQDDDPFRPEEQECSDATMTGLSDTDDILQVPLLGNRVDRFEWTGSSLVFDQNLITLLSFQNDGAPEPPGQNDAAQPARGNHDGGVLAFGPDEKLYVLVGDVGRRGQLQNLPDGPLGDGSPDDQFGGPGPDDAHFTGVILRLNEDGTAPSDNPFFGAGAAMGGEVGGNIQKVFAYGLRNSFGMAFDPRSGNLWAEENGEDAFDELNLVDPGMNSGWIQVAGPIDRVSQYKEIETTADHHDGGVPNLQQLRWMPDRIADSPAEARSRLFMLPGARYSDPEFSWTHVIPGDRVRGRTWAGTSVRR
jgi:glucose/arabinose dehydrogenase